MWNPQQHLPQEEAEPETDPRQRSKIAVDRRPAGDMFAPTRAALEETDCCPGRGNSCRVSSLSTIHRGAAAGSRGCPVVHTCFPHYGCFGPLTAVYGQGCTGVRGAQAQCPLHGGSLSVLMGARSHLVPSQACHLAPKAAPHMDYCISLLNRNLCCLFYSDFLVLWLRSCMSFERSAQALFLQKPCNFQKADVMFQLRSLYQGPLDNFKKRQNPS